LKVLLVVSFSTSNSVFFFIKNSINDYVDEINSQIEREYEKCEQEDCFRFLEAQKDYHEKEYEEYLKIKKEYEQYLVNSYDDEMQYENYLLNLNNDQTLYNEYSVINEINNES
jgi:hypothetical protein